MIEARCSEDSSLEKTGEGLKPARNVVRFTVKEDLSREQTILDRLKRWESTRALTSPVACRTRRGHYGDAST